eukprot:m.150713 g.150713  ORF g.150713 m.150713 type:complete len:114 (+) comp30741_c0_seq1:99-440(+)
MAPTKDANSTLAATTALVISLRGSTKTTARLPTTSLQPRGLLVTSVGSRGISLFIAKARAEREKMEGGSNVQCLVREVKEQQANEVVVVVGLAVVAVVGAVVGDEVAAGNDPK